MIEAILGLALVVLLGGYFAVRHWSGGGGSGSTESEWPKERCERTTWEVEKQPDVKRYTIEKADGEEESIRALRQQVKGGLIVFVLRIREHLTRALHLCCSAQFERMDGYRRANCGRARSRKSHTVKQQTTQHEVSFVRDNVVRIEEEDRTAHTRFITVAGTVEQRKQSEDDEWEDISHRPQEVEEVLVG